MDYYLDMRNESRLGGVAEYSTNKARQVCSLTASLWLMRAQSLTSVEGFMSQARGLEFSGFLCNLTRENQH
jgi:hypothetical protein